MPRYALLIEYDGSRFAGWQRQNGVATVQAVLEEAASRLCGGQPVASVVAGRTDAGVHAAGQVAHIDLPGALSADRLRDAINFYTKPNPVVVLRAVETGPGFSARFSAAARSYAYRLLDRRARPALLAGRVWHVENRLDAEAMAVASRQLLGRHDFTSFRAASCQASSPWRTLDRLDVCRDGDIVTIHADARSFLHHQVRNMAGTLKLVGEGRWEPARVATALAGCDRALAGPTAPPEGLTLIGVSYDPDPFV